MGNVEIPSWLEGLPLAPEFRPTDTEFADPIAYISKIEKEASKFGICKIIPPLPKPSKRYVFYNLNKSLSKRPELGCDVDTSNVCSVSRPGSADIGNGGDVKAVFTTRQQELGLGTKRTKGAVTAPLLGVQKQVWQSGEIYTLEQFESKSKAFAKSILSGVKEVSPMVIEALFWKADSEKPIYVDYANDVPGSAFGEPQEPFRHIKRRRRRKASYWRNRDDSDCKKNDMDATARNLNDIAISHQEACMNTPTTSSSVTTEVTSHSSGKKNSGYSTEMEGTAGWKLSNSPWNLQVIARSPGSITRYMPDDIPGVTSPMVYVGMLFSWFAWHVEDHELHSMNFLHTGSQKTWYAVPGDYAFAFEEVIRTKAYGGNIDHLAALTLLGEKTTLLSPEVLIASDIPCCRLIQNPGEFVVTFPRAYHVGFSHGFNCGEAANFGTPQWLKVAKEAAVRRAAMNYLPMLSHQQLLYLLTMSFVFRVQRSLLPGARSSRLKDRLKEERELLVKKAFIEDILNENQLLTSLVNDSQYHVVLWHPDLLPSIYKEPHMAATAASVPKENDFEHQFENKDTENDLYNEPGLYMESANGLYKDDDDLSHDFQIDSGSLACVACGILGFPFMCVIQPSEGTSKDLLVAEPVDSPSNEQFGGSTKDSVSGDIPSGSGLQPPSSVLPMPVVHFLTGWNTSNQFLRPRTFCLEHAVQVEELMKPKGGANVLVICHSDYERMKVHAVVIADEIGKPFNYSEIPLGSASQEELRLIDLATGDEERDECGEDWTSKLGVNFRYCVKVRKESPSKEIKHALSLAGFSDRCCSSSFSNIKWKAKKSRSKTKLNCRALHNPCDGSKLKEGNKSEKAVEGNIVRKEDIVIQYSRRKFKLKSGGSSGAKQLTADVGKGQANTQADGNSLMTDVSGANPTSSDAGPPVKSDNEQVERVAENPCGGNLVQDSVALCNNFQQDVQALEDSNGEDPISRTCTLQNFITPAPFEESFERKCVAKNFCGDVLLSNKLQQELMARSESDVMKLAKHNDFAHAAVELCNGVGSHGGIEQDIQMVSGCEENLIPSVIQKNQPSLQTQSSEVEGEPNSVELLCGGSTSVDGVQNKTQDVGEGKEDENVSSCLTLVTQPISASVESSEVQRNTGVAEDSRNGNQVCSSQADKELESMESIHLDSTTTGVKERKRKREVGWHTEKKFDLSCFVRSPCEGLRPRVRRDETSRIEDFGVMEDKPISKKVKKSSEVSVCPSDKKENIRKSYKCDIESCHMSFKTKTELHMHKRNQCPHEGCRKRFRSHKYAVLHQRVHDDERPLKCPWEGCSMSFKWAWARTEHIRVHTGERPYQCKFEGCGLSFRFVSDYSRHRRKTGHYVNSPD